MKRNVYASMWERKNGGQKSLAVLVDPDKADPASLPALAARAEAAGAQYFFVGGSLVVSDGLEACVRALRSGCRLPVVLFPGSPTQLTPEADALLYLSLISGRNADLLIGQHVVSAPAVRKSGLEILSTGYMVVDGGAPTTVSYISNAAPIPSDKSDIALCTAMAGEMLGLRLMYLDAGSGARQPVPEAMIRAVSRGVKAPLIVGGGIRDGEAAFRAGRAGADIVVVGNAIEQDDTLLEEMCAAVRRSRTELIG